MAGVITVIATVFKDALLLLIVLDVFGVISVRAWIDRAASARRLKELRKQGEKMGIPYVAGESEDAYRKRLVRARDEQAEELRRLLGDGGLK